MNCTHGKHRLPDTDRPSTCPDNVLAGVREQPPKAGTQSFCLGGLCGLGRLCGSRLATAVGLGLLGLLVVWCGFSWQAGGILAAGPAKAADEPLHMELGLAPPANQTTSKPETAAAPDLTEYHAPRRTAPTLPPAGDRIQLDPSLAETPSLPVISRSAQDSSESDDPSDLADEEERPAAGVPSSSLARQSGAAESSMTASWPLPGELLEMLQTVNQSPAATRWAANVRQHLEQLHSIESLSDRAVRGQLKQLRSLAEQVPQLAQGIETFNQRAPLLRAGYALERRLAIWQPIHMLAAPMMTQVSLRDSDQPSMQQELQAVEQLLSELDNAASWRAYLLLDRVHEAISLQHPVNAEQRSHLARQVLERIHASNFTRQQQQFFEDDVWRDFARQLRRWVSEPVSYHELLKELERFEQRGGEQAAGSIASQYQILRWSPIVGAVELSEQLNRHYRNANVRTAISDDFLNRLIPEYEPIEEDVNDVLLGGRVFGHSRTSTRLRVVLVPDRLRWRLGLEAEGQVDSQTETERGPARFHNVGRARFLARKFLLIDRHGIDSQQADAEAISAANLAGLETDFDGLPLFNNLARAIARQQYESKAQEADWEIRGLVAGRARNKLDEEVERQLKTAAHQFREKVQRPLQQLGLHPEPIDMQTTEQRLIARYRLAGDLQLGASTPRPQAPSDSLISVQIHQSALNNLLASLQLHGHESGLRNLFHEIANKLQQEHVRIPDDVPQDVTLQFAKHEPIRMRWEDDRIHITLRIARLSSGHRHVWQRLEVRAIYGITSDGLHVRPVRDSYIRLKGYRLSLRDQIALRGIFSKVFSQTPDFDLLGNRLVSDPRLRSLIVTQFVIRDGWIGLAIGAGNPVNAHLADEGGRLRG